MSAPWLTLMYSKTLDTQLPYSQKRASEVTFGLAAIINSGKEIKTLVAKWSKMVAQIFAYHHPKAIIRNLALFCLSLSTKQDWLGFYLEKSRKKPPTLFRLEKVSKLACLIDQPINLRSMMLSV